MTTASVYNLAVPKNSSSSNIGDARSRATEDALAHPKDLTRAYRERYGVSRVAANKYVQKLEAEGWLSRSGPGTRPVYSPGYRRLLVRRYQLAGLEEDIPWEFEFSPAFSLRPNVRLIAQHGFTEMVNNAIDHSQGSEVSILMTQDEATVTLQVSDNGIGIFRKIAAALELVDLRQALFELAKGKFTTDPSRHSGEGVFFTSRMFDGFVIEANGLTYSHFQPERDFLQEVGETKTIGTRVIMRIGLESARTTAEVFQQFMDAPEDYGFTKTVVPMNLARYGDEGLVSRSQARRLIARFDRFKTVMLDFAGVDAIGQAFADELFRVYANEHPDVTLAPLNMTDQVTQMWRRATVAQSRGESSDVAV